MYAIIRDRGMQYRVEKGQKLNIALLDAEPGSQIELAEVLLIGGTATPQVGNPLVAGARVRAQVLDTVKGEKIVVFRYRNKKRFRRRTGHRQRYTRIEIEDILVGGDDTPIASRETRSPILAVDVAAPINATED